MLNFNVPFDQNRNCTTLHSILFLLSYHQEVFGHLLIGLLARSSLRGLKGRGNLNRLHARDCFTSFAMTPLLSKGLFEVA